MDFLKQALVGGSAAICNIAIHALVMTAVIRAAQGMARVHFRQPSVYVTGIMIATVSVLMLAHVVEVLIWALTYATVEAVPDGSGFVYFAFVNYTTLGYGDIVPLPAWRLLGPITAMNGVLLFGWSTAVIFEVLRRSLDLAPLTPGS